MAVTNFTPLLGLALPTTGDLSGTWGTTVNDAITDLLDDAVAGTVTLTTDANVTLTTTNGADNQARNAIILCTGARTAIRTITAPAQSKLYVIINATSGGFGVKIVGAGPTTGITVLAGTQVMVAWNGSDFIVSSGDVVGPASATDTAVTLFDGATGKLVKNSLVTVSAAGAIVAPQAGSIIPFYFASTLPAAGPYHGAVAHLHSTGKLYFAHSSAWQIITNGLGTADTAGNVTPVGSAGQLLTNDGSGGLTSNTTGTGVVTALGVNTGSAGAFVVNGGALGTPSSGTATNLTGLPLSTGVTGTLPIGNGGTGLTTTPANGALDIGNGTGFTRTTLTAGSNITITNGSGAITIAATASASAATPTVLGTVYGATSSASPNSTFVGYEAGASTTGIRNTLIGFRAGFLNVTGTNNVIIGFAAGENTTGSDNTFVGARGSGAGGGAGNAVTSGARHTLIGQYDGNQDGLDIRTATNYAVISDGAGNRLISTANGQTVALDSAVPNSGTGITFPASQSASTNDNTLDDYEEGTWTPAYTPYAGSFSTITYYAQIGYYQKIGNTVHIQMFFYTTNFSVGTATGQLFVTGLPFTAVGGSQQQSAAVGYTYQWETNSPTKAIVYQGTTRFEITRDVQGVVNSSPELTAANLKNGNPANGLSMAISYRVA